MKNPKVYLFDLKENELPVLYFQNTKVCGLYCPVCKKQHNHTLTAPNQPISSTDKLDHPVPGWFFYAILRKEHKEIVCVERKKWLEEATKQVENIVGALWQSEFDDNNIFVFRKYLSDGTCEIGSLGRIGIAKKKTNEKLQAVSDNFLQRLNRLKAFW